MVGSAPSRRAHGRLRLGRGWGLAVGVRVLAKERHGLGGPSALSRASAHLVLYVSDPAPPSPPGVLATATPRRVPLRLITGNLSSGSHALRRGRAARLYPHPAPLPSPIEPRLTGARLPPSGRQPAPDTARVDNGKELFQLVGVQ